jgi:hypothetical protein
MPWSALFLVNPLYAKIPAIKLSRNKCRDLRRHLACARRK